MTQSGSGTPGFETSTSTTATDSGESPRAPERPRRRRSRAVRWLLWIGGILLGIVVILGVVAEILLHRAEPMLRARLIDTLQKQFHSRVELDEMHVSVVKGFQVEVRGLRIWLPTANQIATDQSTGNQDTRAPGSPTEPWIYVSRMHFHASWRIRPSEPVVISVIHVEGVRVLLPPKEDRPRFFGPSPEDGAPQQASDSSDSSESNSSLFKAPKVEVRRIECKDGLLVIQRKQKAGDKLKIPLDFQFQRATIIPDGKGGPVAFDVDMVNAKPIGTIHSKGHAGPWAKGDPGALPVEGDYTFDHADLSTIKGIAGILSSTGHYSGCLNRIEADGQTQTPDFRLDRVAQGSGLMLKTRFHAIVDGTNGNTYLQPVDAVLGHTHILAKGSVVRAEDASGQKHGHDIVLDITIDRGHIEDILQISANRETPFMTGYLTLSPTHFHLPPGKENVVDKLLLDGSFHLSQAEFTNPKMQGRIEDLSMRGQGKPGEVKTTDPTSIHSEMQGHFSLGGGMLRLPDLTYQVPGALIEAHGVYGLQAGSLAFEGDAKLDATLSKVVGGWKGFLLKPADRYLRKNGAGTDVPIHVSGTRKDPKFGVDFGRLGKTQKPSDSNGQQN